MARTQFRSKRKITGKKYISYRKKRVSELGGTSALTLPGKQKAREKRVRGGNIKKSLLREENVIVNNKGKTEKVKIQGVANNPANIHYTRRSIITKGSILRTEKGNVKVTTRPGQDGTLFGVYTE